MHLFIITTLPPFPFLCLMIFKYSVPQTWYDCYNYFCGDLSNIQACTVYFFFLSRITHTLSTHVKLPAQTRVSGENKFPTNLFCAVFGAQICFLSFVVCCKAWSDWEKKKKTFCIGFYSLLWTRCTQKENTFYGSVNPDDSLMRLPITLTR